jgi:hypothetical protein
MATTREQAVEELKEYAKETMLEVWKEVRSAVDQKCDDEGRDPTQEEFDKEVAEAFNLRCQAPSFNADLSRRTMIKAWMYKGYTEHEAGEIYDAVQSAILLETKAGIWKASGAPVGRA